MTKTTSQSQHEAVTPEFPQTPSDALDQMEAFTNRLIDDAVRMTKDSIDYSVAMYDQWRKMSMDAARKALARFDIKPVA